MTLSHEAELDRKLRDLSVMYELTSSIGTSLDLQRELDHFLQKLLKRFGFSLGSILFKSEEDGLFYVASSRGHLCSKKIVGHKCRADQHSMETVFRTKKPLLHSRMSDDQKAMCLVPEIWKRAKTLAYLPIVFEGEVIGLLKLFSFSDKEMSEKVIRMITPLADRLGTVVSHILMLNRLRDTEKRLREEKDFTETAFNSLTDLFVVIDPKTRKLIRWNRQVNRVTGLSNDELANGDFFNTDSDVVLDHQLDELLAQDKEFYGPSESLLKTKNGEIIPIEVSASRFTDENHERDYITAMGRDIRDRKKVESEKRELEEQLHQKYKMEAVGLMAGGIAHNFNNSLAIVLGNLELVQRKADQPDTVRRYARNAQTAVLRARDLVNQILTYSRKGEQAQKPIKFSAVMNETLQLLHSTAPTTIELNSRIDPACADAIVRADPSRIQEVLLNLYTNALHALNEEGEIVFSLAAVTLAQEDIPVSCNCLPGRYARLGVQDNGCGMNPEILNRIFDPFFSTKEEHQGTGMGLATVQGIVNQHNGFIQVASVPDRGTLFSLFFPVILDEPESTAADEAAAPEGSENILYVDDEPMVAELARDMLCGLGYQVTIVFCARDALALVKEQPNHFDLVMTDQTMPGMTGLELSHSLARIDETLPIVLCTGYSSKVSQQNIGQDGIRAICTKPLKLSELANIVRKAIDGD